MRVDSGYISANKKVQQLRENTGEYEQEHFAKDYGTLDKMISAAFTFCNEALNYTENSVREYTSGSVANSTSFQNLSEVLEGAYQDRQDLLPALQSASENEQARFAILEKEWAKAREEQGWLDFAIGALVVVGGVFCIVATAGLATPLVVAGAVAGTATMAYGYSNMIEANQNIALGMAGDYSTAAYNPMRDTIFGGNQKAYDIFGTVCIISSSVLTLGAGAISAGNAAISAGTSVGRAVGVYGVKTVTTFAGGMLGGWGGKELALNLGASETMANLTGILTGTFAALGMGKGLKYFDQQLNLSGYYRPTTLSPEQLQQRQAIGDIESGKQTLDSNAQKGNYGEMKMDQYFEECGSQRISGGRVTDLNASTKPGIDGVYLDDGPPPKYIIAEAKYNTSRLSTLTDGTKQMSDKWIIARLEQAVGYDMALEIMASGYDKVLFQIMPDSSYTITLLP